MASFPPTRSLLSGRRCLRRMAPFGISLGFQGRRKASCGIRARYRRYICISQTTDETIVRWFQLIRSRLPWWKVLGSLWSVIGATRGRGCRSSQSTDISSGFMFSLFSIYQAQRFVKFLFKATLYVTALLMIFKTFYLLVCINTL